MAVWVEAAAEKYLGNLGSGLVGECESLKRVEEFGMVLLDAVERVLLSKSNVGLWPRPVKVNTPFIFLHTCFTTEDPGFVEPLKAVLPDTVDTALFVKGSSTPSKSLLVLLPFILHLKQWWLSVEVSKPRKNCSPHFKHLRTWAAFQCFFRAAESSKMAPKHSSHLITCHLPLCSWSKAMVSNFPPHLSHSRDIYWISCSGVVGGKYFFLSSSSF